MNEQPMTPAEIDDLLAGAPGLIRPRGPGAVLTDAAPIDIATPPPAEETVLEPADRRSAGSPMRVAAVPSTPAPAPARGTVLVGAPPAAAAATVAPIRRRRRRPRRGASLWSARAYLDAATEGCWRLPLS